MRSPGLVKTWSLRNVETLSRPALVLVSAIMTRPSRTKIPQQYVIPNPNRIRPRWITSQFRRGLQPHSRALVGLRVCGGAAIFPGCLIGYAVALPGVAPFG